MIHISIAEQSLILANKNTQTERVYKVNTSKYGCGEKKDSLCTPRGKHIIAEKIGANAPLNTLFVARQPTGEIYRGNSTEKKDWILTRIIRLRGMEYNFNCGGNCDSYERFIYIHGSPDDADFSTPQSNGCIRMRNDDIVDLFDHCRIGDNVFIFEHQS